jgi:hypothetical protein
MYNSRNSSLASSPGRQALTKYSSVLGGIMDKNGEIWKTVLQRSAAVKSDAWFCVDEYFL